MFGGIAQVYVLRKPLSKHWEAIWRAPGVGYRIEGYTPIMGLGPGDREFPFERMER